MGRKADAEMVTEKEEEEILERVKRGGVNSSASRSTAGKEGVLYLGHIPHGFYEDEMKGFFSQFGTVASLRLSRSKKTGRSRGYAFIRFESPAVAKIAQETMDGYILSGKTLKCEIVPPGNVHPRMFAGCKRKFKTIPWAKLDRERHNKKRTNEETAKRVDRLIKKDTKRRKRFKDLGIDYEFEGYKAAEEETAPVTPNENTAEKNAESTPKAKKTRAKSPVKARKTTPVSPSRRSARLKSKKAAKK